LFLKTDGSVWGMGDNSSGQLGDGTLTQVNRPKQLVAGGVVAIAARSGHSLLLKEDGSLWAMGNNAHGELGDGTFADASWPEQIVGPYNRICIQQADASAIKFLFVGIAESNYALERSYSLYLPVWEAEETNRANSFGSVLFTATPNTNSNNFWQVRYVP
jgi:alpha-tubulin suppressor-like RCC1 family protein